MHFSKHFRIGSGLLKIKTSNMLRPQERVGAVSVWRIGKLCVIWVDDPDGGSERKPSGKKHP